MPWWWFKKLIALIQNHIFLRKFKLPIDWMLYHGTCLPELIPFCSAKMSADYKHPCLSGIPQKNTNLAMCGHHKAKQDLLLCGDDCKHLSNDIHNCVTFLATTSQWLPDAFSQGTGLKGRKARQLLGSWFLPSQSLHSFLLLKIPFASPHMWHCPLLSSISWLLKIRVLLQ